MAGPRITEVSLSGSTRRLSYSVFKVPCGLWQKHTRNFSSPGVTGSTPFHPFLCTLSTHFCESAHYNDNLGSSLTGVTICHSLLRLVVTSSKSFIFQAQKMPADSRSLIQTAPICRYFICCLTGQHFVLSFSLIHNVQRISAYLAEQKENFHPSCLCLGQSLPESRVSVYIGLHLNMVAPSQR